MYKMVRLAQSTIEQQMKISEALPFLVSDFEKEGIYKFVSVGLYAFLLTKKQRLFRITEHNNVTGATEFDFGDRLTVEDMIIVNDSDVIIMLRKSSVDEGNDSITFWLYNENNNFYVDKDGETDIQYECSYTSLDFNSYLAKDSIRINSMFVQGFNIKKSKIYITYPDENKTDELLSDSLQDFTLIKNYKYSSINIDVQISSPHQHERFSIKYEGEEDFSLNYISYEISRGQ